MVHCGWLEFKPFEFLSYKFNGGVDLYFYENSWFRGEGNWQQNQEHRDPELDVFSDDFELIVCRHLYFYVSDRIVHGKYGHASP